MKVAIVADWLTDRGGAERVVQALAQAFPDAPIYTSVYEPDKLLADDFAGREIRTTYLQKFPRFLRKKHQLFPVLRAHAFRQLDLSEFDVIISSASAEAKAVKKRPGAVHICYCHTPVRYYWSHYEEYLKNPGLGLLNPIIRLIMPAFVAWMRKLDLESVSRVDYFLANSTAVQKRIKKYYRKDSTIVYPPVDIARFEHIDASKPREGFVIVGRQVPYKRIDLAIEACNRLKLPLTLFGDGSEHEKLVAMAGPTIKFVVGGNDVAVNDGLAKAAGFISPQVEDFGIAQVEALATGIPIIAYKKDGALDIIEEGKSGVFFAEQTVESLARALESFQKKQFSSQTVRARAQKFSLESFVKQIREFVAKHSVNVS